MKPVLSIALAAAAAVFSFTVLAGAVNTATPADGPTSPVTLRKGDAFALPSPTSSPLLGIARAGQRLVAVGSRGVILLSDDEGRTWRQAKRVPVRTTLTAISFADELRGWAVGHDGAIVATSDGGESWVLQRFDGAVDRSLFSVHFQDVKRGMAVGLWSLVLVTQDGGATWREVQLPPAADGGKADRNLFQVFPGPEGLYVAAERGTVLFTKDEGRSWSYIDTGYKGSFWCGIALDDGTLVVAGLRGTIYRSQDQGRSWQAVPTKATSSITALLKKGRQVVAVGLDGYVQTSDDGAQTFTADQRPDRVAFTAAAATKSDELVLLSKQGVVGH